MLLILKSGKEESAKKIFSKWSLDFSVIGKTTNTNKLVLKYNQNEVANLPLSSLSTEAPIYDRKWKKISISDKKTPDINYKSLDIFFCLKKINLLRVLKIKKND
jgi:phosphoribosylformylglycinamidine synthase